MIPPGSRGTALDRPGATLAAMTARTEAPISPGLYLPTADQRVGMLGRSWADYEAQLALQGDSSRPKLAYLDGAIELMSPARDHERINSRIGRVIDAYLVQRGLRGIPNGEWTLKNAAKDAGCQPDECYLFGDKPDDQTRPDLVIEINWSRGGIDKLEIYRRLEIPEVWFWEDDAIAVYTLAGDAYQRRERSTFLPDLDLGFVCSILDLDSLSAIHAAMAERLRTEVDG